MLRRPVIVLGGTTTSDDCAVAASLLAKPGSLVQGPSVAEYEREFARVVGLAHTFTFASGRVGFYGLLKALGVGPGDEVLLQVPTHIVVANAIRYLGARPVFVDCRLENYNMDLEEAERKVTARTKVLLVQHTFGVPVDMRAALELARRHGLEVIEDCVHALGATYDGRPVGSFGRAAFFSTEETKTINSVMGGVVATDDPELARRMQEFQAQCSWPKATLVVRYLVKFILYPFLTRPVVYPYSRKLYELAGRRAVAPEAVSEEEKRGMPPPDYEQRLSNAQALLALRQLRRLDQNVAHRRAVALQYAEALSPLGFRPPESPPHSDPAMVRYPVWVQNRARALEVAAPAVALGKWFTSVLEESESPSDGGYDEGSCPRAESAARHLVNLPTHGGVSEKDIQRITTVLADLADGAELDGRRER